MTFKEQQWKSISGLSKEVLIRCGLEFAKTNSLACWLRCETHRFKFSFCRSPESQGGGQASGQLCTSIPSCTNTHHSERDLLCMDFRHLELQQYKFMYSVTQVQKGQLYGTLSQN